MKKFGILMLSLLIAATAFAQKTQDKTVCFDVNIHCGSCKAKIEKNIAYEKGVKDLVVFMETHVVKITYDPSKTNEEKLIAAFKKIGYEAKVKTTCCKTAEKPCAAAEKKECNKAAEQSKGTQEKCGKK